MGRPIKTSKLIGKDNTEDLITYAKEIEKDLQQLYLKFNNFIELAKLDVDTTIKGETLFADGDAGGETGTTGLSNDLDTKAAALTSVVIRNGNAGSTHQGWIKGYVGTAVAYIPYWD